MVDDRFIVEADRQVVGVAVKVRGGFRFFASDPDFNELESKTFPRARAMAKRVAELARARRGSKQRTGSETVNTLQ